MKTQKLKVATIQILIIIVHNYLLLFDSHFIYRENLLPSFLIMITFFNLGTFFLFYVTIASKEFTAEKEEFLLNHFFTIYVFSASLGYFHNCLVKTDQLTTNYFLGTLMLFSTVILLYDTIASYKNLKSKKNMTTINEIS